MKKTICLERLAIIGLMILVFGLVLGLYVSQMTRVTDEKPSFGDVLLENSEFILKIDEITGERYWSFDVLGDCYARDDDKAERLYCFGNNGSFELDLR